MGKVIDVDEDLYKGISSDISSIASTLEGAKGKLEPCFSGELASYYSGSCNTELESEIADSVTKIENTSVAIDASIDLYEKTDDELALGFDEMVSSMFNEDYSSFDEEEFIPYEGDSDSSSSIGKLSLEERRAYLDTLIDRYESLLNSLKDEFSSKYSEAYGHHFVDGFDAKTYSVLETLMVCFIGSGSTDGDMGSFNHTTGTASYTIDQLERFSDYVKEHDLFTKLDSYFNGKTWKESGMSEFNDIIIHNLTGYDNYKLEHEGDENISAHLDECVEASFLGYFYYRLKFSGADVDIDCTSLGGNISELLSGGNYEFDPEEVKKVKAIMGELYKVKLSYQTRTEDNPTDRSLIDYIDCRIEEYYSYVTDIQTISATLYNYKQARLLLPYQMYLEDPEFLAFFEGEFEDEYLLGKYVKLIGNDSKYLSDEEIAIYAYLAEHVSTDEAKKYLSALTDKINNAKGMEEALNYINELQNGGMTLSDILSVMWNGGLDGISGFFEGIGKFFNPTQPRTVLDYKISYLMELLTNPDKYGLEDINLTQGDRDLLRRTYNVFNGVGNMLIPQIISLVGIAGSAFTGNPGVAALFQKVSSVLLGLSVAGKSANEAILNGHDLLTAYLYGGLAGASEAIFERLGGIIGLGDGANILGFNGWAFVKAYLTSMFKEGAEEFFQEYFDAGIRAIILGEPFDLGETTKAALVAGMYGMAVAGVMNSPTILIKVGGKLIRVASADLLGLDAENMTDQEIEETLLSMAQEDLAVSFSASDLETINSIIEKYDDNIPDYLTTTQEKLNYLIRNGLLKDGNSPNDDFYTIMGLDTIKNFNPENLLDLYAELSRINNDAQNDPNYDFSSSNFHEISNILYMLLSMRTFRNNEQVLANGKTVKQILNQLTLGVDKIGAMFLKNNSTVYEITTDSGETINVNIYGVDEANIQTKLREVEKIINNLPPELRKTYSELDYVLITDEKGFYSNAQLKYNQNGFMGAGGYNAGGNYIILSNIDSLYHEIGHAFDAKLSNILDGDNPNSAYITDYLWETIIEEDGNSVTEYGDSNIHEDFAESIKWYLKEPEKFKKKFPHRYEMIQRMLQMSDPDNNLTTVEETQSLIDYLRSKGVDEKIINKYEEHLQKLQKQQ